MLKAVLLTAQYIMPGQKILGMEYVNKCASMRLRGAKVCQDKYGCLYT